MVKQPRGINLGAAAGMGAVASLLLGTVTFEDAVAGFGDIWDAALAFVGIVTLSATLDAMGFFKWAALRVAKLANGSGVRLYFYVALLSASVSILFANDSAVLILTPIVLEIVSQLRIDEGGRLPYLFAAGLVADTAAMPLITSNPVNIVSADFFGYTFMEHLAFMGPVAVVTIAMSIGVVYLFFRRRIPGSYPSMIVDTLMIDGAIIRPLRLKASFATLVAIDVGYVWASLNGVPVSFVICAGAAFLLAFFTATRRRGFVIEDERRSPIDILRRVNWDILVFMVGIFLVVQGLRHAGAIDMFASLFLWSSSLPSALSALAPSLMVTVSASAMNNWPMTMLGLLSIRRAAALHGLDSRTLTGMIFSNIIGNNLGPHFFPLGSLAILMWLGTMRAKGLTVSLSDYLKVGSVLSLMEVVAASIVLWLEQDLLQMSLNINL